MKKMTKIVTVLMLVLVMGSVSSTGVFAKLSDDQDFALQTYFDELDHGEDNDNPRAYVDLNGDKIQECIYIHKDKNYIGIYGYNRKKRGKKFCRIKKIQYGRAAVINYSKKKHRVLVHNSQYGGHEYKLYTIKKFKAKKVKTLDVEYVRTKKGVKEVYRINKKRVSAKKFNKQIKSYKKNTKRLNSWD